MQPTSIAHAEQLLAETFADIANGLKTKVTAVSRADNGGVIMAVACRGSELVRMMQVEAFIVETGDTIRHRSQLKDGNTLLVFQTEPTKRAANK